VAQRDTLASGELVQCGKMLSFTWCIRKYGVAADENATMLHQPEKLRAHEYVTDADYWSVVHKIIFS
jgi:hypothetical protein